eukprot:8900065-Ditylum_brightwellii.AAC.1
MMHNAELHRHLSPSQYGGRKGMPAINIPVITVFNLDTLYLMQANMAFMYCDARACYNRIVVIMAALSEQAAGLWTIHREELPLSTTSCSWNWTGTNGWTTKVDMHSEYST